MQFGKNKKLGINVGQIKNAGPPPPGDYEFVITNAEVRPSRTGMDNTLRLELEVADEDHKGRCITLGYSLSSSMLDKVRPLFEVVGLLGENADADAEIDLDDLLRLRLVAELSIQTGEDGKEWPRLSNLRPANGPSSTGTV